jgi:hypothetical protein
MGALRLGHRVVIGWSPRGHRANTEDGATWFLNSKCGEHDRGMTRMPKSDVDSHFQLLQDYRDLVLA